MLEYFFETNKDINVFKTKEKEIFFFSKDISNFKKDISHFQFFSAWYLDLLYSIITYQNDYYYLII